MTWRVSCIRHPVYLWDQCTHGCINFIIEDLQELLKLEPDNKAAKTELDRISNVSILLCMYTIGMIVV